MRSWSVLERIEALRLPEDLARRDEREAIDVGWAEQMLPFIERLTDPGDLILDPFAGLGTTLVAAHELGRRGLGIELDGRRARLAAERLQRLRGGMSQTMLLGDADSLPLATQSVDAILTNIPYFEGRGRRNGQLYAETRYSDYVKRLPRLVKEFFRVLRPGGRLVAMAQNVRRNGRTWPLAWDWGRTISQHLILRDEHILLYSREPRGARDPALDPWSTDRSHELAICAEKPQGPTWQDVEALWPVLKGAKIPALLMGSLARRRLAPETWPYEPHDLDILIPDDAQVLRAAIGTLQRHGFELTSWQEPIGPDVDIERLRGRWYLRARRSNLTVDLVYECPWLPFHDAAARAVEPSGIPVMCVEDQDFLLERRRSEG